MGQEIDRIEFAAADFEHFRERLEEETTLLARSAASGALSSRRAMTGFEVEAWMVDRAMNPAPLNRAFLDRFADPLASAELAKFNVEFNTSARPLQGGVLTALEAELDDLLKKARAVAGTLDSDIVLTGILPTLRDSQLTLKNLSESNRYRALNDQIFRARRQEPIRLNICGHRHLESVHRDVMLESATTSFQIHWQVPCEESVRYFNAALLVSAPVVAVGGNSPFLFGHDLWAETRIPLFEQAIPVGGYRDAAHGPLYRVSFGTGYARKSLVELFEENVGHFPVLLPILFSDEARRFAHLRLHNGTIWRWNRPLVGFDADGTPHLRIEHRCLPAGPTIEDMIANAALYYGLVESLSDATEQPATPFAQAKDNFYLAARHGLAASVVWDGERWPMQALVLRKLLALARQGLERLGINSGDRERYLGIIEARVASGQTGSEWQRRYLDRHPGAFGAMTREYLARQCAGIPVHEWPL